MMPALTFLFFLFVSPPEILKGTILDPAGTAVAGARVEISDDGVARTAYTDDGGRFAFDEFPAGTYSVQVTANGFASYVSSIAIPSDPVRFTLRIAPHSDEV